MGAERGALIRKSVSSGYATLQGVTRTIATTKQELTKIGQVPGRYSGDDIETVGDDVEMLVSDLQGLADELHELASELTSLDDADDSDLLNDAVFNKLDEAVSS